MDSNQRWVTSPSGCINIFILAQAPSPPELVQSRWSHHINPTCAWIRFVSRPLLVSPRQTSAPTSRRTGRRGYSPALRHMYNASVSRLSATYWPLMKSDGLLSWRVCKAVGAAEVKPLGVFQSTVAVWSECFPKVKCSLKNEFAVAPALIYVC